MLFSTTVRVAAVLAASVVADEAPKVVNKYNDITYIGTSNNGVEQFQNIRFAEDTSGANRFEPPKPFYYPQGTTVQATAKGPSCPQATKGAIPAMVDIPYQSEDCLNLRIARPAAPIKKLLPVMVYIYGGGSILGSAYDEFFTPDGLINTAVENADPVIYAAFNYRLGVFGFAASKSLYKAKKGNLGLRDQYAALEWIRDNIADFGGDPTRVTIFGQSFGGISVGLQLTAYGGAKPPLFHKGIMTSGAISGDRSPKVADYATGLVADALKCTTSEGVVDSAAFECMKKVPLEDIAKVNLDVARKTKGGFGFAAYPPGVDKDFIPAQPDVLLKEGRFLKNIPLIVTWAADDGSLSADTSIKDDAGVIESFRGSFATEDFSDDFARKLLDLYPVEEFEAEAAALSPPASPHYFRASRIQRDIDPTCPLLRVAGAVSQSGNPDVYVAELNETRLTGYWDQWGMPLGVSHLSDVPYFFNEEVPPPADNGPRAKALSAPYSGSFSSFAATGSPVKRGKTTFQNWPKAYSPGSDAFNALIIGGPTGTEPYSSAAYYPFSTISDADAAAYDEPTAFEITIERGDQIIFDALLRTGSAAAHAGARAASHAKQGLIPGKLPQKKISGGSFADEKLKERCELIYSHRI